MAFGDIIQAPTATAYPATSVTVTITSATAGNLLVCIHFTGASNSTAPAGFSEAIAVTDGGNADQGAIYYKIAAGGETSVAPGSQNSDEHGAQVLEIEGPFEALPLDVTASNGATSEASTSSGTTATTAQNDEVAVAALTCRAEPGNFASWTNAFVERGDVEMQYKALGVATKLLAATGTVETTASHASAAAMGMIATFKKQAAGGGDVNRIRFPAEVSGMGVGGMLGGNRVQ